MSAADEANGTLDVIVVGGGIAGLTAAWMLRHRSVLVLEASDRFGGRMRSEPRGEYWLNLGAHLFPGRGSLLDALVAELGLETLSIPGSTTAMEFEGRVFPTRRVEAYPLRLPLSLSERIAFARAGLKLRTAVRRDLDSAARGGRGTERRRAELDRTTFAEFLGPLPRRVEGIFRCAARRATAEANEMAASVGIRLFAQVWSGPDSEISLNLRGGTARLPVAMAQQLGAAARTGSTVTAVEVEGGEAVVTYCTGSETVRVSARHVIVAAPAHVARRVVRTISPPVERFLRSVSYGPFLSMAVLTSERDRAPWDDVYALMTPGRSFDMLFNHASCLRRGVRRPGGSLMVYVGGPPARSLMESNDEEVRDVYLRDLYRVYPSLRGHVSETLIHRWDPGNTFRRPGVAAPPAASVTDGSIHFAGDYFAELGNMEAAARSGRAAARAVMDALGSARVPPAAMARPATGWRA